MNTAQIVEELNKLAAKIQKDSDTPENLQEERLQLLQRRDRIVATLSNHTRNYDERLILEKTLNEVREQIRQIEQRIFLDEKAA